MIFSYILSNIRIISRWYEFPTLHSTVWENVKYDTTTLYNCIQKTKNKYTI